MPNESTEPEPTKEKKELKIRDLNPKEDAKGGGPNAKKDENPTPRRTGEIDFMKGVT